MRLRKKLAAVAVTTALAASLAACGGDDSSDEDSTSDETSETTEEPSEDETTDDADDEETDDADDEGGASDADLTEPGATLSVGEAATVPYGYAGNDGVIEVTVTAIEEGTPADLEGVDGVEDQDAYYVQFDVAAVENAEGLSGMTLTIDGIDDEDNPGTRIISFTGGVDGCATESAPSDWDGSSFSACMLVASPTPITKAIFSDGDYSWYSGDQVTWES